MVHWCPCCCIGPCVVIAGLHFDPAVVPGSWSSVTAAIASSLSLASGQEWEATPGNSYWRNGDFSWMFDVVWWFLRLFCYGFACSVLTQILPQQECVLKMEAATLMLRYVAAYVALFCPCAGRRLCVRNWKKGPSTWVCAQRSLKLADGWWHADGFEDSKPLIFPVCKLYQTIAVAGQNWLSSTWKVDTKRLTIAKI